MRYKLLDNKNGVILSRSPEFCKDKLSFEFEDVPEGATAIFEYAESGIKYFREISNGTCELPLRRFDPGTLTLTVAVLDGSADPQRWLCEELSLRRLEDGTFLILPNDGDLPLAVAQLRAENSDLRRDLAELEKKYKDLSDRLERIMEGYDLT